MQTLLTSYDMLIVEHDEENNTFWYSVKNIYDSRFTHNKTEDLEPIVKAYVDGDAKDKLKMTISLLMEIAEYFEVNLKEII